LSERKGSCAGRIGESVSGEVAIGSVCGGDSIVGLKERAMNWADFAYQFLVFANSPAGQAVDKDVISGFATLIHRWHTAAQGAPAK